MLVPVSLHSLSTAFFEAIEGTDEVHDEADDKVWEPKTTKLTTRVTTKKPAVLCSTCTTPNPEPRTVYH